MRKSAQYRLWKHLNKYFQKYIGTFSAHPFDRLRYKIWKKLSKTLSKKYVISDNSELITAVKNVGRSIENSSERVNIIVAGRGFSGNTAVKDFFRNFEDVESLLPEFDWFRGAPYRLEGTQAVGEIRTAFLDNQPLRPVLENFKRLYRFLYENAGYRPFGRAFLAVSDELCECLSEFDKEGTIRDEERFADLVKQHLTKIMSLLNPNKKFGLFQHVVQHWRPLDWQMAYMPDNARIIRTLRDPRDSWTDMKIHGFDYGSAKTLDLYIASFKDRNAFAAYQGKNVKTVWFEDLCLNYEKTNDELKSFVGLTDKNKLSERKLFVPEVSAKNVGIYKTFEKQEDIRRIETALAEYLYENR